MQTTLIKLDIIRTDLGTQPRAIISDDVVAHYAERMVEGDKFPAVDVFHDGNEYILADGFHRFFASKRNEFKDILAVVHQGTRKDALWFALGANKEHGLRRSGGDNRKTVVEALREFPEKSQREISNHIGCSVGYVNKIKNEVFTSEHLPDKVTGKDGKTYAAKRPAAQPTLGAGKPSEPVQTDESKEQAAIQPVPALTNRLAEEFKTASGVGVWPKAEIVRDFKKFLDRVEFQGLNYEDSKWVLNHFEMELRFLRNREKDRFQSELNNPHQQAA